MTRFSVLAVCLAVTGCATSGDFDPTPSHDNTDATIWLQTSTEYAALTTGVYASASATLKEIANTAGEGTRGMTIVLDIDETVLDNARYQGQLIRDDATYDSESWDAWVALRDAVAVPGAVDFIRTSQSLGFHVTFITNRPCRPRPDTVEDCPQKKDTLINLQDVGIDTAPTTLFLMGERPSSRCEALLVESEQADGTWSSDKTSRRDCISLDYDIVMLFGDQLGDFTAEDDDSTSESGRDIAADYAEYWGRTWFMLPNPTYGGWRPRDAAEKRELILGID